MFPVLKCPVCGSSLFMDLQQLKVIIAWWHKVCHFSLRIFPTANHVNSSGNIFTKVQHRAFINSGCFVIQEKIHVMQDHLLLKARALRSVLRIRQWSKIVVSYMTTFKKILIKNKTNNTVGSEYQLPEQFKYQTS